MSFVILPEQSSDGLIRSAGSPHLAGEKELLVALLIWLGCPEDFFIAMMMCALLA